MHDILFVGGPLDGERRMVKELWPWFDVPCQPVTSRPAVYTSAYEWPAVVVEVVEYTLQLIHVAPNTGVHFYAPKELAPAEAVRMLIAGYRQPKPREER